MSNASDLTCPVCGNHVGEESAVCEVCGFNLVGATQVFQAVSDDAAVPTPEPEAPPVKPVLQVVKGPLMGATFQVEKDTILGRDPKATIFLNDMTVSRKHARITIEDGKATLDDLGSLNGTWVDGAIVTHADLSDGATVQIGTFSMVFRLVEEA